jgi:hypothetical protein
MVSKVINKIVCIQIKFIEIWCLVRSTGFALFKSVENSIGENSAGKVTKALAPKR